MDNLQDQQGDLAWYRSLYIISLTSKILNFKAHSIVIYMPHAYLRSFMLKTTLTLSAPLAKTLKIYTVQFKGSLHAQSKVVEEALIEFFERHNVNIEK